MTIRMHDDWATPAFDLAPVAPSLGPFPGRRFLQAWSEHRPGGTVTLVEADAALVPIWEMDGVVRMAGDADLTDYHAPLGSNAADALAAFLVAAPAGRRVELDSLPQEAAEVTAKGMAAAGIAAEPVVHAAALRLELPGDFDTFLAGLDKKERHELRRKHRRFELQCGPARLARDPADGLATFIDLHRRSPGRKGGFMTEGMASFFSTLATVPGARIDVLGDGNGVAVAASFGFVDAGSYYLYNSAYDPARRDVSPGIVLLERLIAGAIAEELTVFDFLKGDEDYKVRLGAVPRPLYVLEGRT